MVKNNTYEGITQFQLVQLCMNLKEEMVALKIFAKMSIRKPSERMAEEWLNSRHVMSLLKITKGTLQSLRDKGILPYTIICSKIYYKSDDVEAILKSNYRKVNYQR
jgi:hypothetical protein